MSKDNPWETVYNDGHEEHTQRLKVKGGYIYKVVRYVPAWEYDAALAGSFSVALVFVPGAYDD